MTLALDHMEDQTDIFIDPNESQAERLARKGVNMDWYYRSKAKRLAMGQKLTGPVPLENQACSPLSIYLLKADGSLWTIEQNGEAYMQVRAPGTPVAHDVLVCAHCKQQFKVVKTAYKHF